MSFAARIITGAIAAVAIALAAHRARSLSASGAVAAVIVGTATTVAGWSWAALLIVYFVSSTLLSRLGRQRKMERTAGTVEKAGPRDAWQVMSNGLAFAIAALLSVFVTDSIFLLQAAGAGALAASAADTWATEIGTLVGHAPRSILTGRKLAVGQSGGVTFAGTLASVAGAAFVALTAIMVSWNGHVFIGVFVGGILGATLDSAAGAVLQRRQWCDACGVLTEMRVHQCGSPTKHAGGLGFVGNDLVNLFATVVGALVAAMLLTPGSR